MRTVRGARALRVSEGTRICGADACWESSECTEAGCVCAESCGLAGRGQLASNVCRTVAHGSQGVCVQAACPGCARVRALQSGSVCGFMDGGRV